MEENLRYTQGWYCRCYLIRCLYLLPKEGVGKELFFATLPAEVAAEARKSSCIRQKGDRIFPRSPLLFQNIHPTQAQILEFLTGLYQEMDCFIDEERQDEQSLPEKAQIFCRQYDQLYLQKERFSPVEAKVLEKVAPLVHQLRMQRIGGVDHLKDEIRSAFNTLELLRFRNFGSEERKRKEAFHLQFGQDVCRIFERAMATIELDAAITENLLDLLGRYYQFMNMFPELATVSERLLSIQTAREAPSWVLSETHARLADGYFGSFNQNERWLELSSFHRDRQIELEQQAIQELQMKEEGKNER